MIHVIAKWKDFIKENSALVSFLLISFFSQGCDWLGIGGSSNGSSDSGAARAVRNLAFTSECSKVSSKGIRNVATEEGISRTVLAVMEAVEETSCQRAAERLFQISLLDLSYQKITDLSPLRGLPVNILSINLEGNYITDLRPLSNTSLREVKIQGNAVKDLKPLLSLDLISLTVDEISTGIAESLKELPNLSYLEVNSLQSLQSEIKDLSFLDLRKFKCAGCAISSFSQVRLPIDIKSIVLVSPNIQSLNGVEKYTSLEELVIEASDINDIGAISNLKTLNSVFLRGLSVGNLSALSSLTELRNLEIESNQEALNINGLNSLERIGRFQVLGTAIDSLNPLINSSNSLRELSITDTLVPINDVSALSLFTNLKFLNIPNLPQDFDGSELAALSDLNYFECRCAVNQSTLEALGSMENLEYLIIFNQGLQDLSVFSGLSTLRMIGIGTSGLASLDEIFIAFPSLQSLVLYDPQEIYRLSPNYAAALKRLSIFYSADTLAPNIFDGLAQFSNLDTLRVISLEDFAEPLSQGSFGDLNAIGNLPLNELHIQDLQINDAEFLQNLNGLRKLSMKNTGVTNLQGLSGSRLTELEILESGVGISVEANPNNCPVSVDNNLPRPLLEYCSNF